MPNRGLALQHGKTEEDTHSPLDDITQKLDCRHPCFTMAPTSSRALKKDGMQFGFSIVGVVFLAMLFVPNIIWGRNQPPGYAEISKNENRILLALERIGEVAATCTAVIFVCPQGFSFPWLLWLIAAFALMILYEIAWMRYFNGGGELADMYRPLGPIPIPLASLPVAAIFLLGVWYQSPLTLIAAIVLGIGHIGIHLGHVRELSGR